MTHCPTHADEVRSPRFAELDALIAAGYGSMPFDKIEAIRMANGGTLPQREPEEDTEPFIEWVKRSRMQGVSEVGIVYAAVQEGYSCVESIAEIVDKPRKYVSAQLTYLRQQRLIQVLFKEAYTTHYATARKLGAIA